MTAMTNPEEPKKKRSYWYSLAAWVLSGAVAGYIGADLITGGANGEMIDINISQIVAILIGFILVLCTVIVGVGFTFPKAGIAMKMFEDIEEWEDERSMMGLSAFGGGAWGGALIVLALAEPLGLLGSPVLLAVMGVLLIGFVYSSWRLLREYDELWQGVNAETCTYGMYLMLLIGGTWSVVAHLGFISALAPLDWISLLTATCLVGAILATRKRGMLED
ncbi:hypothetical protein [Erythrobacter sp. KY5]|uniref:hypothetical protein n=1 Tax=Erythrobacter sp. KY5 TaxID=2011159 RepID=UPI0013A6FC1D|nr:hypothetical protein [Erythrobacter sp. KY5]